MRKVLKNHSEVAHYWANKVQPEGNGSSMFYHSETIYSYGHHFPIAKHINNNLILFTSKDYSSSTSKHKCITRSAIPSGIEVLTVPIVRTASISEHIENVCYFTGEIKRYFGKSQRARKYKGSYLQSGLSLIKQMERYLELFRIKSKLPSSLKKSVNLFLNMDNSEVMEVIKVEQEIQKKAVLQQRKEQEKKFKQLLPKWKTGEVYNLPYHKEQYLRLVNDEIETSLHVKISIDTFNRYYSLLKVGVSLIDIKIDHYRVTKQDSNLITIGCHRVPVTEVEYIAKLLK